jgi:hypothetical protein
MEMGQDFLMKKNFAQLSTEESFDLRAKKEYAKASL